MVSWLFIIANVLCVVGAAVGDDLKWVTVFNSTVAVALIVQKLEEKKYGRG